MKRFLASTLASFACAAAAQAPTAPTAPPVRSDVLKACADCGEVRSIRRVERPSRPPNPLPEREPSGLVASIPLDGSKPTVGSSTRLEKRDGTLVTYEVIVRLEDGRIRVVTQDDDEGLQIGDRVRIEDNKVKPR